MKISWLTFVAVVVLILAGALIIQLPQVQTYATKKIVSSLSEKLDGEILFEKIHLKPFTTLVLKNAIIIDKNPVQDPTDSTKAPVDTFFRAEYIIAKFTLNSLLGGESIGFKRAFISNAQMNLVLQDVDGNPNVDPHENLSRIFRLKKKEVRTVNPKELFRIKEVEIDNFGFALINHSSQKTPLNSKINWNDLDISNISISARDLKFKGGVMSGAVERMSFREKSGFNCKSITGQAAVGNGKTIIKNLKIRDDWSDIDMPLYMMSYANPKAFSAYITDVKMDAEISESILDFRTLSYFASSLDQKNVRLTVSGNASGYVDDFTFANIRATSHAGGFSGLMDGRISGLPKIETTNFDGIIRNFNLTTYGLSQFVSAWMEDGKLDLSHLARGFIFNIKG